MSKFPYKAPEKSIDLGKRLEKASERITDNPMLLGSLIEATVYNNFGRRYILRMTRNRKGGFDVEMYYTDVA